MAKVYAAVPGDEIRIDTYGTATETEPVEVPAEAVAGLRGAPVRIEADVPAPRLGRKAKEAKED